MSLNDPFGTFHTGIPGTVSITSNSTLTVYATFFLAIHLLAHRRRLMLIAYQGDKTLTQQPLCIATILLESAVVNVPIAVASAVGLENNKSFGGAIGFVVPPIQVYPAHVNGLSLLLFQALASVIIIHQVALNRAFDRLRELGETRDKEVTPGLIGIP